MPDAMAVQVTIYLNEADQWHHRPLHMEILNYLRKENVFAATAFHALPDFSEDTTWKRRTWSIAAASCR